MEEDKSKNTDNERGNEENTDFAEHADDVFLEGSGRFGEPGLAGGGFEDEVSVAESHGEKTSADETGCGEDDDHAASRVKNRSRDSNAEPETGQGRIDESRVGAERIKGPVGDENSTEEQS